MTKLRLIPVVIFAAACLFGLKTYGLVYGAPKPEGSYSLFEQPFWKHFAGTIAHDDDDIITGATPGGSSADINVEAPKQQVGGRALQTPAGINVNTGGQSPSEKAIAERLSERRAELEAKSRDMEMRENLMKAAEKRLEARIEELKKWEGKDSETVDRLKGVVTMYENMRPKDAARIFDRMEMRTLFEIVNQMNPRKVSEVMALMKPENAERLTGELARRRAAGPDKNVPATDLPRIGGEKPAS
jgi:flagellar motility protein MotE (MotC chaperone)